MLMMFLYILKKKIDYVFLSTCLLIDLIFTIEYCILRELFIIMRILIN